MQATYVEFKFSNSHIKKKGTGNIDIIVYFT